MAGQAIGDDVDWNLVRTFVVVAEQGSLAGAAASLGLAHPTVARHVQHLEAALGITLFDRRPTGLTLNTAGERLALAARGMLDGARAFAAASRSVRSAASGRVRITASELIADVFPELLTPLRRAQADGLVNIELLVANDLLNLLHGEADIAIRHVEPRQQELIRRRLCGLPFGLFASRGYLAERGRPSLENLHEHWFIDGIRKPRLARESRRLGHPLSRDRFVFRSDHFAGRLHGALAGWGIAAVPRHVAVRHSELERVLEEVPVSEIEMWLVGRQDVRRTPYLREAFATAGDMLNAFVAGLEAQEPPTSPGGGTTPARPKQIVST
jgi:DNA-binding transcriptional LysR family regulator